MNIVIVKHENCGQKFLFQAPDAECLKAGDLVRVKTKKGLALATCLCDSFHLDNESQEMNAILMAFGTSQPLAPVVGKFSYHEFIMDSESVDEKALSSMGMAMENFKNGDVSEPVDLSDFDNKKEKAQGL